VVPAGDEVCGADPEAVWDAWSKGRGVGELRRGDQGDGASGRRMAIWRGEVMGVLAAPCAPQPHPSTPEAKPDCGNSNSQAFVESHFQDAAKVASDLGIGGAAGDADILTLSALESGWGTFKNGDLPGYPGAWFGMQGVVGVRFYPGETKCVKIGAGPACEMEFSSFAAAAAVFEQNKGSFVKGVSDPTQFFTDLHDPKAGFSQGQTLAQYLHDAVRTQKWVQDCLKTLGLAQ